MVGPAEVSHGPMLISLFIGNILYGVTLMQSYIYFRQSKDDKLWMKLLVGGSLVAALISHASPPQILLLFVADTVTSVLQFTYLYFSLIVHFGDVSYLQKTNWIMATNPPITVHCKQIL